MTDILQTTGAAWGTHVAGSPNCAATRRGWPDAAAVVLHFKPAPARPSRQSIFHLASHSAERSRPPLLRLRLACSSLQKRAGHLAASVAVISSVTPTPQQGQLCLGKDESVISFHHSHGGSSPELALHAASYLRDLSTPPMPAARSGEHHRSP